MPLPVTKKEALEVLAEGVNKMEWLGCLRRCSGSIIRRDIGTFVTFRQDLQDLQDIFCWFFPFRAKGEKTIRLSAEGIQLLWDIMGDLS